MILTYHEAIELMSYLPMALPALQAKAEDQSELAHLHQDVSDLEILALDINAVAEQAEDYIRKTA